MTIFEQPFRGQGGVLCPSSHKHVGRGDNLLTSPHHVAKPPAGVWGTATCGRCGQVVSCEPFDTCVTFHPHFTAA